MTDVLTVDQRRHCMSHIRGVDTKPELKLRSYLHSLGLRYRLHVTGLPGKPDLVFPKYRCVVFVHGCFWHRHKNCRYSTKPANNRDFWSTKLSKNAERDQVQIAKLRKEGWRIIIIWECGLRKSRIDLPWLASEIRDGTKDFLEWPIGGEMLSD